MSNDCDELIGLRAENARLIALLESHGIDSRRQPAPTTASATPPPEPLNLSTAEKVALLRRLFRGRTDVHPVRWESAIADETQRAIANGRKVLVLTERTDHLDSIRDTLERQRLKPFVLHGRMSRKQRVKLIAELDALPPNTPRILLATGRLVGEGFDHPPLDTLILTMPVSWEGTLQQYAGRLHREHAAKTDIRIIDFVDSFHPALLRVWEKRQPGYRAMGYRIAAA